MIVGFNTFLITEGTAEDLKSSLAQMGYEDIRVLSARRFKIVVPAKERMEVAQKIAKKLGGTFVSKGNEAGKPVLEFEGGYKLYVKPIPGSGVGGTAKEDAQLASLQKQIQDVLDKENLMELPLKVGNKIYQVAGAATTPGTPKSDFHLLNLKGDEVVWISHKDGTRATHFQQWSGMSERADRKVAEHPESKAFVQSVKDEVGNVMPRATTLSRLIKDKRLVGLAVYGSDYGSKFGRQNVTVLLQGPVKLTKVGDHYELQSNHTLMNGDAVTGDYAPAFMAIYKGDRSNYNVKGARFAVQPKASRKSRSI